MASAPLVLVVNRTLFFPDLPLSINGPSPISSEATDMFAMGSLIYQVEHGTKPDLSLDSHEPSLQPEIRNGHAINLANIYPRANYPATCSSIYRLIVSNSDFPVFKPSVTNSLPTHYGIYIIIPKSDTEYVSAKNQISIRLTHHELLQKKEVKQPTRSVTSRRLSNSCRA